MDSNQNQKITAKRNKALILIIIVSLLVIFIVAISLLMAKNVQLQNNGSKSAEEIKATKEADALNAAKMKIAIKNRKLAAEQASQETASNNTNATVEPSAVTTQDNGLTTEQASQETVNTNSTTSNTIATNEADSGIFKINISGKGFAPSSFTAPTGRKVIVEIANTDKIDHNITFDNSMLARYNTTIAPGETKSITIKTPTAPGTYAFSCTIAGHKGETGKMIIK